MKQRILLIPSDHGGGRGHVSRCLYLTRKLNKHDYDAAIVLEAKHFRTIHSKNIKTFLLDTKNERYIKYQFKKPIKPGVNLKTRIFKKPTFIEFNSLAYQVPRDGYWTSKLAESRFKKLNKIVDDYKPDILIGDTHFLTYLCGRKFDIPVIQITRLAGFPIQSEFTWWMNEKIDLNAPDAIAPFKKILDNLNITESNKAEDLLKGDLYIIPSIPEIEPVDYKSNNIIFSGALSDTSDIYNSIPFFEKNNMLPKIYISIGGGAGRSNEKMFFDSILSIFNNKEFRVLVSTGNKVKASNYNDKCNNVHFENWVPGLSAIHKSDLVIHHGGYGTTQEVLSCSKPSIIVPSHTEQEGNGRRLEYLKLGRLVLFSKERKKLEFSWPYGTYSMNAGFDFDLNANDLENTVADLLDPDILVGLKSMKLKLEKAREEFDLNQLLHSLQC